ncbi:MAG: InlB B-repeat-containing protein [Bacilli bacterium]|nr:InlB B-repeat-containing protein [Bacilli bacterium]
MSNKYIVKNHENSKYYKDVPYITKKEFRQNEDNVVVATTRLKKYNSDSDIDELELLSYKDNEYKIKSKMFGFKKGYIWVGDNNYVLLKTRTPFLFLLLLLLLILLLLFCLNFKKEEPKVEPENNTKQEEVIPEEKPKEEKKEETKKDDPYRYVPKRDKVEEAQGITYTLLFDANGGEGKMDDFVCNGNEVCKLPKSTLKREGYVFTGWSTEKDGEPIYLDEMEVFNLSTKNNTKIVLYAMWHIVTLDVEFLDYDGSLYHKTEFDYGDSIVMPENPQRDGYTFLKWDNDVSEVKEDLVFNALYNINNYNISYDLNGGAFDEDAPSTFTIENESFEIPNPIKTGYTFLGWTDDNNSEPNMYYEIEKGTIDDINLIANYEPNSYRLLFNTNGAKENIEPKEIEFNTTFGELPSVTKDGYEFVNWTDNNNKEVSSSTIFSEPNDIIVNANWITNQYNITYNLVGGSIENAPTMFDVESDDILIPNPTKDGYIFAGWLINDNNEFITDYIIENGSIGDIELTANYKPISYTIVYNSNGGNGNMVDDTIKYNNKYSLKANTFTKEGHTFEGWSTEKDGEVKYLDKEEICNLTNKNNEVINLYAKWNILKFSVKYYDKFGVLLKDDIVNYGETSIAPPDPYIDGYTFTGWGNDNEIIKSDKIYTAQYTTNDYKVQYDLNMDKNDDVKVIHYSVESDSFSLPIPEREGYTFLGWTGSNGLRSEREVTIPKASTGNKNYKANWIANMYKVNLNANNGLVNPNSIDVSYNSSYGILPNATRDGYTFEGWYFNNNLIDELTIMDKSYDHELKADWKVITYNISYNLNGGSVSSNPTQYNIETDTFTLNNPTRKGYKFLGWTGSNGNTPSTNVQVSKGNFGDKEYTANWEIITYTISYSTSMSSLPDNPVTYTVETESFTLNNPSKYGEFSFVGWSGTDISDKEKTLTIPKGSIGNRTYTANWYDDTPPTITGFSVRVIGRNPKGGHDVTIYIEAYDNGVGVDRYETWLVPYLNGHGAGRELGGERYLENVLYLDEPAGRTLCGYAIDKNGNEAEACYTVYG